MRPLATTEEYFKALADSIRVAHTAIIDPAKFNAIINVAELNYVMEKLPKREFDQKVVDDISILRVKTDGAFIFEGRKILTIQKVLNSGFPVPRMSSPYYNAASGMVKIGTRYYPLYLQGIRVDFLIDGVLVGAKPISSDEVRNMRTSSYRKPKGTKCYFEMANQWILGYFGDGVTCTEMNLEYYTYPRMVFYDEGLTADRTDLTAVPASPDLDAIPVIPSAIYTTGSGSVNSSFEEYQKREIIDIATRSYLEIIESTRYKSMLNEFAIKSRNK